MPVAWIGLGANLGDREGTIRAAFRALAAMPEASETVLSPLYETAPVGPPQPAYLNACARLRVAGLLPGELLARMRRIEDAHGRRRAERWGPRTLDLDLLLFDGLVLDGPGLVLPHPRLHERAFVLKPLADLEAGLRHPVLGRTVAELLKTVGMEGGARLA